MPNSDNEKNRRAKVNKKKRTNTKTRNRKAKRTPRNGENRKPAVRKGKKNKHPKLMIAVKIFLVIFLLLAVIGAGVIAGIFFGLFGDDFEIKEEDLKKGVSNSVIVNEKTGEIIADLSTDEKRKKIKLEDMADYLPKAYVAIEDERFYKHNGVDFKRTAGAILHTVMGNSSYGGSTITQQLVKNATKDDASKGLAGIKRKVKEWAKAYQVERMMSKDQILELYLNILYIGMENLHGVELGAQYYFNKSAKDLDLAECAYLAGINSSPNYYNPYSLASSKDTEEKRDARIKNKTLTVLKKMKDLGYIENEEDYNTAVEKTEAGLTFERGKMTTASSFSYHTDALIEQLISQVMEERNCSRALAENYVYGGGYTIYSTVDKDIQARLEEEYAKTTYKITSPSKNQTSQSGMAIVDYKTGNVVGVAGGLGEKETGGWNRATQMKKQPGSVMKPIADVAPALEEKVITAATAYYDVKTDFGGGYIPKNEDNSFKNRPMNIREFIAVSRNIPAVKIMAELTPAKSIEYLQKFGLKSVDEKKDDSVSLALGGMTVGASPLELASAYGTIANGGVYITPTFYTKVVDSEGNVIMTPKQEKVRVLSEQNAYIVATIVQEPVIRGAGGTASNCAIAGMDVAAKTGTTDNNYDRWLAGFTPYYSAATWFGYDTSEEVKWNGRNPAGLIWSAVMSSIHKGLPGAKFVKPDGVVEQTVCSLSGGLATTGCPQYTEIFTTNNLPEKCQGHGTQAICSESKMKATEFCSQYVPVESNAIGAVLPNEQGTRWKNLTAIGGTGTMVEEVCTIHTKPKEEEKPKEPEKPVAPPKTNTTTGNTSTSNTSTGNTTNGNVTEGGTTPENTTGTGNTTGGAQGGATPTP